jgi:carboxyl-terminal processing protease
VAAADATAYTGSMRRRLPQSGLIIAASAVAALMLSFTKPSPEGLVGFGVGEREVRAAPGTAIASAQSAHNLTALRIFNRTLVRVRDSYVDPARIDPKAMLYAALDSVQFHIPEVMIDADEDADTVTVHVSDVRRQFSTAGVDSPWRLSGKLKQIFRFIEANMNSGADLAAVEYAAVNGMLSTLDPHSVLLDPDAAREMDVSTSGKFGGLGIVIEMRDRRLTVVEPMADTPAARAGIEAGDHIARIDEEVTENLTLSEAVERMRGHPGSRVTLWIERDGVPELLQFDLTRAQIQVPSVESELLAGGVGYLNVKQFASRTAKELREHMDRLEAEGARAWILDLRTNPGGLLEQAILVADLFVDKGTLVTTVGGREREPRRATRRGAETEKPMAVLVSGVSASASEIVAGSLKNLDRALVLGSTTFGKGSVQILYDNEDGSKLKLTIAEYLTPGDRSIQSLGIVPDIELQRMFVPRASDRSSHQVRLLPPTRRHGEADLKAHLDSEYAVQSTTPKTSFRYLHEPAQEDQPVAQDASEDEADPLGDGGIPEEPLALDELPEDASRDVPVELARHLLTRVGSPSRSAMFDRSRPLLDRRASIEQRKLERSLARLGVDWSPAPRGATGAPRLEGSFTIEAEGGAIRAGEDIILKGTVENTGDAAAHQVHARVEGADYHLFQDVELVFGRLAPGETRTWTTHLTVPQAARDRIDVLSFAIRSAEEAPTRSEPLKVRVEAAPRPVFAYSHHLIDEGNGDGLVQRGERHRLRVTVRNSGEGASRDTTAILRNASGEGVVVRKGRFEIGALDPGASHTVDFIFDVTDSLREGELVVEMTVYDRVLQESVNETLTYPIAAPSSGPAARQGWARVSSPQTPIYQGASTSSRPIAHAARGASFPITGELGTWLRVDLGERTPGFVRADAVTEARSGSGNTDLEPHWHVQPPTLELSFPSYETSAPTYSLTGTVKDLDRVEDVYIFVSNRGAKIENRKVFYQSNRGTGTPRELPFSAELPLWPGTNQVTVVARKSGDVRATHTVYLYRHTSNTTASATARIVSPPIISHP